VDSGEKKLKENLEMRILVGMPEQGSRGGSPTCEPPFVSELRRLGLDVEEHVYTYADTKVGVPTRVIRVLKNLHHLRKKLRSDKFDVLHLNTSFDSKALLRDFITVSLLRRNGTRIFLKFHGSDASLLENRNRFFIFLRNRLFSCAEGIGVLSSEERANFLRVGVLDHKLFLVSNVVSSNAWANNRTGSDANSETQIPHLLFTGRFIPEKGLHDVIRACDLLRRRGWKFVLVCLGDGPARRDAEREVARLGLRENVRFLGHISEEDASVFYASGTVLVFPTYHCEGFPMTIFNAVAAGLPIITTRIRAAADYLQEPDNCLWAMPQQPPMLADKIIDLLENAELRLRMSRNNTQLAARFSREKVTQEYVELYQTLIGEGRNRAS
jgi:glycosyltransferase involved in cell wall biosynthesis